MSPSNFVSFCFNNSLSPIGAAHITYKCGTTHWDCQPTKDHTANKIDSASPRNCQLLVTPYLGEGTSVVLQYLCWNINWLDLCRQPWVLCVPEDDSVMSRKQFSLNPSWPQAVKIFPPSTGRRKIHFLQWSDTEYINLPLGQTSCSGALAHTYRTRYFMLAVFFRFMF